MRRQSPTSLFIPLFQMVTDLVVMEGSFLLSYWLRFYSPLTHWFPVTRGFPGIMVYFWSSLVIILIWLNILRAHGLYGARRKVRYIDDLAGIVRSVSLGMLLVMAATFFYRGFSYSRLVFVLIWVTSIILLGLSRFFLLKLEMVFLRRGRGLLRTVIIGSSRWGRHIYQQVNGNPGRGLSVIGYVGKNDLLSDVLPCLGGHKEISRIATEKNVDVFVLAPEQQENSWLKNVLNDCIGLNVELYLVPGVLDIMTTRPSLVDLGGIPILKIKDVPMTGWSAVLKSLFDYSVAVVALLLLWPLFFVIALIISIDSRGGVFYRQKRVGINGREFDLVKFRSMREKAEVETGPVWAVKGDPRVTRIGRLLRRLSLDEFPQLINILKGDMSLVGPRPERPHFVDQFGSRVPKYMERLRVKSGMTGWAQVNGLRGNVPIADRTQYDVYYVENWSFLFDIKILIMTFWIVLTGRNSY